MNVSLQPLRLPGRVNSDQNKSGHAGPHPERNSRLGWRGAFCGLRFRANGLHKAALEHPGGRGFRAEIRKLTDEPARFLYGLGAVLAAGGEVDFQRGAFISVQRAKRVGFEHFAELVAVFQVLACNPCFKRSKPFRIQLFTVPSGSFKAAAISLWLRPSK